jgi:ribosomal silencing factor RsfS
VASFAEESALGLLSEDDRAADICKLDIATSSNINTIDVIATAMRTIVVLERAF